MMNNVAVGANNYSPVSPISSETNNGRKIFRPYIKFTKGENIMYIEEFSTKRYYVENAFKVMGVFFLILLFTSSAFADTTPDVTSMLANLQKSLPPLFKMATGAAYVMGVSFVFKGLYDLKIYGESRTMMSGNTNLKSPIFIIVAGVMCLFSPSAFNMVMQTTFGYTSILAYDQFPTSSGESLSQNAIIILQIIQVVGIYAFIRGWVLLARSASNQGAHGLFARGITHVVGGVFAINIVGTCNVIAATFGITF
jgi:intracellular multiplication protein IcmC